MKHLTSRLVLAPLLLALAGACVEPLVPERGATADGTETVASEATSGIEGASQSESVDSSVLQGDKDVAQESAALPNQNGKAETASEPMQDEQDSGTADSNADQAESKTALATFGAGCYWCVEAVLEQIDGVSDVTSGFMGGHVDNPSYYAVCSGKTGHAEVVQVTFDPQVVSYDNLLSWFWRLHDPTTLNSQGNDHGTQYRSAIYFHSDEQRVQAEASMKAAQDSFTRPIVTEVTKASTYYQADKEHQDYYRANKQQGYCRMVIAPKLDKLKLKR